MTIEAESEPGHHLQGLFQSELDLLVALIEDVKVYLLPVLLEDNRVQHQP